MARKNLPVSAFTISVWNANGGPVAAEAKEAIEDAVTAKLLELFNDGHRLLTQTTSAR